MAGRTTGHTGAPAASGPEPWQATLSQTHIATQIAGDENDYLAAKADAGNIGRRVGADQHELFVSCGAAEAMQQQLDHIRPEYIALHDLGTQSSRKLLAGVASATQRSLQRLVIRRQGYGTPLVTLEFVDVPVGDGTSLRLYTTASDVDHQVRHGMAKVLLAYSRLGVLMVGEMPLHLLKAALAPLREAMVVGPWVNRDLLLLPLWSSATLAHEGLSLGQGTGVQVRTTPQVTRPADAWSFISGTWNKLRVQCKPTKPTSTAPDEPVQPTSQTPPPPMTLMPMPAPRHAAVVPPVESTLGRYVRLLADLPGMVSCAVFDLSNGRPLVHAGARPGPEELGTHGSAMVAALGSASRALGLGHVLPEATVTLGAHHLLLRGVPKHPGVALHAVLDRTHADLALARQQIGRMDALFDEPKS